MCGSDGRIEGQIEVGLRSYAEPPEIPDTRIALAAILERAGKIDSGRSRRWMWAFVAPFAAVWLAVLTVAILWAPPKTPQIVWRPKPPSVAAVPEFRAAPEQPSRIQPRVRNAHPALAEAHPLPKLDVFPTPRPMTPEEEALSRATSTAPPQAIRALLEAQIHPKSPADLAELKAFTLDDAASQAQRKEQNLP